MPGYGIVFHVLCTRCTPNNPWRESCLLAERDHQVVDRRTVVARKHDPWLGRQFDQRKAIPSCELVRIGQDGDQRLALEHDVLVCTERADGRVHEADIGFTAR